MNLKAFSSRAVLSSAKSSSVKDMGGMRTVTSTVAALMAVVMLGGCAGTEDGRLAQGQGTVLGAMGGAILGGVVAAATGGDVGSGAATGAVAGGAAGFAYGTHIANKKAKYARHEEWLDACIAEARRENRQALAYNSELKSKIAALESRAAQARSTGDKAALASVRNEAAALETEAKARVSTLDGELKAQRSVLADKDGASANNSGDLRQQVAELKETRGQLGTSLGRLASLSNSTDA